MIPSRENRPSTANTMLLVLKPRPVEYTTSTDSSVCIGSENEREAWRKNRVMQMKLGSYLTEVHQQQRSSSRLLKTEEYRFLQEAMRRSGVPKSVNMLDQLHFYREHTFPGRRFSSDWHFREGYHPHHKHPPLSARPLRPHRQRALLNRPKTSATLYRKNINEEDECINQPRQNAYIDDSELTSKYSILVDPNGRHVAVSSEQKIDQIKTTQVRLEQDYRQSTELPPIKLKDNKENMIPLEAFKDSAFNLPHDLQTSTRKTDIDKDFNKNVNQTSDKAIKKLEQLHCQKKFDIPKQRNESVSSLRMATLNKNNDNVMLSRMDSLTLAPVETDREFDYNSMLEIDPFCPDDETDIAFKNNRVNDYLEKQIVPELEWQQQPQQHEQQQQYQQEIETIPIQFADNNPMENIDETRLALGVSAADEDSTPVNPQKRLLRQNTRTNFNRVKAEPVMPLRHNITSVLRQERTRFEASQKKVKDYLHTMSSRDTLSRHSTTVSREHSAHSRKSAGRRDESKPDTKFPKKTP